MFNILDESKRQWSVKTSLLDINVGCHEGHWWEPSLDIIIFHQGKSDAHYDEPQEYYSASNEHVGFSSAPQMTFSIAYQANNA